MTWLQGGSRLSLKQRGRDLSLFRMARKFVSLLHLMSESFLRHALPRADCLFVNEHISFAGTDTTVCHCLTSQQAVLAILRRLSGGHVL